MAVSRSQNKRKGTWHVSTKASKKKLHICTPHNRIFPSEYVICAIRSLSELSYDYDMDIVLTESALIHANRNALLYNAYAEEADYVVYIDNDMLWSPDDIRNLIATGKDVVSALTRSRTNLHGIKNPPVVFEYDKNNNPSIMKEIPDTLFEADAVGTGFLLITKPVVTKLIENIDTVGYAFDFMKRMFDHNKEEKGVTSFLGEDISFCYRAKQLGFSIWCEPKVQVGHIVSRVVGLSPDSIIRATRNNA